MTIIEGKLQKSFTVRYPCILASNPHLSHSPSPEVLKALWDLSDADKDGMLNLREFCTTLYFIDRIREGRELPPQVPPGIHFDDPQGTLSPEEQRAQIAATRLAEAQAAVAKNHQSAPWRLDPSE